MTTRTIRATFESGETLLAAAREARGRGYQLIDAYTPHPVHGLEAALGLAPSRLSWVCFGAGALGVALALYFQYWTSAWDWPLNVGGKPFDSLPAFVPVAFEIAILFAGLGVVAALLVRCGLLPGRRARLAGPRTTDDRYVLDVRMGDARHTPEEARRMLVDHGAVDLEDHVEEDA